MSDCFLCLSRRSRGGRVVVAWELRPGIKVHSMGIGSAEASALGEGDLGY